MPHIGNFPVPAYPKPLALAPPEFVPRYDTNDWEIEVPILKNRAVLTEQYFRAPVNLPQGATITKVTLYGYRSTALSTLDLGLYRSDRAGSQEEMARCIADWTDEYGSISDESITYPTIDNVNYEYGFQLQVDPDAAVDDCTFTGVVIEWT